MTVAGQSGASRGSTYRAIGRRLFNPDSAPNATAWFLIAAVAMTWPLARGLARDIPLDLGDSLLNCWILGWGADHLLRFLSGDPGAFAGFWNANIFHPAPLALAYSEHLFAQVVQILPVYALTGNLILCYNLLFLSTFVLSALGAYLLVREITGDGRAGVLAGCLFGFALYRVSHYTHLQVLSAQWMPFVFFGLRRHFDSGRWRPLAGALLALVAENLSCGYYLVFFAPLVPLYVLYEMWNRRRFGDLRLWGRLLGGAVLVALMTWPFVQPYLELRREGFPPRMLGEVERYSADVLGYATANPTVRVWGKHMLAFPKVEGDMFPGLIPALLAAACLGLHFRSVWLVARQRPKPPRRWRWVVVALAAVAGLSLLSALVILIGKGFTLELGLFELRVMSLARSLENAAIAILGVLLLSPRTRAVVRGLPTSVVGFFAAMLVAAFALSLGPTVFAADRPISDGWYLYLYKYVPGFDGLRVPARMGMLVALSLSVLGGLGAAQLVRRSKRWIPVVWVAALAFLVEGTSAPIATNEPFDVVGFNRTPEGIETGRRIPPVYQYIASLEPDSVIIELPFGAGAYDVRYVYYSTAHWRRLVNGYSGGFPPWYDKLAGELRKPSDDPQRAFDLLKAHEVTHVVVHEAAYSDSSVPQIESWLRSSGATEVAAFGESKVFSLRPAK